MFPGGRLQFYVFPGSSVRGGQNLRLHPCTYATHTPNMNCKLHLEVVEPKIMFFRGPVEIFVKGNTK